jgi:hypothetical protein
VYNLNFLRNGSPQARGESLTPEGVSYSPP